MKRVVLFFVFFLACTLAKAQGFIWAKAFQQINLNKMLVDDSDNIYSIGTFQGTVDADPDPSATAVYNLTAVGHTGIPNKKWRKFHRP